MTESVCLRYNAPRSGFIGLEDAMFDARAIRRVDKLFLSAVVLLTLIGIAFIWSTTHYITFRTHLAQTQVKWLCMSLVVFVIVLAVDYKHLRTLAYPIYILTLAALAYVLLFGEVRQHARRWITLFGYNLQPSEFAKIAVVLALARYLQYRRDHRKLTGLILPFLMVLVPMGLIVREPDLGTTLVFLPALFVMLYVAGASVKHLGAVVAAGVVCAPLMWRYAMSPRQQGRILGFIDPLARASREGWHVRQSLAAIVSGGWTGEGFASGSPVLLNRGFAAHTDFIFSVIAHECGFLGALVVLLLLFLLFSRGVEIAGATREPFGRYACAGLLTILAFQTLVNIGMTIRLCPITGLTLPFVSYGGSSLLSCFVMAAIILNVGMRRKAVMVPE